MTRIRLKQMIPGLCFLFSTCGLFEPKTGVSESFSFFSASLGSLSSVLVYYPESYDSSIPVIYLLNGWGADASAWGSGIDLEQEAHDRDIFFVSLTAGTHTYTNDSHDTNEQYEDYVIEIVSKVESEYNIARDNNQRALCGISNGGGGATYLLSEYPDLFIACGSLSGTVYSGMTQYQNFLDRGIRIDVGTEDGSLSGLRWLNSKLDEEQIEHEYLEHPGGHDWTLWAEYAPKQFDFLEEHLKN